MNWIRTNITLLGIFVVISTFFVIASYFKGRSDAREACTNKYEAQIAKENAVKTKAIADRLKEIQEESRKLREEYAEINRQISEGVFTRTETIYRTVEKAVEKPVYVQGDCSISYDDVARVFDTVATAAGNN